MVDNFAFPPGGPEFPDSDFVTKIFEGSTPRNMVGIFQLRAPPVDLEQLAGFVVGVGKKRRSVIHVMLLGAFPQVFQ